MLARMNFASALVTNQRFELRNASRASKATPEQLYEFVTGRLTLSTIPAPVRTALLDYIRAGGTWTGSDAQLLSKTAGLFHLLVGSGEFQFV
jgi:hypothetical protein